MRCFHVSAVNKVVKIISQGGHGDSIEGVLGISFCSGFSQFHVYPCQYLIQGKKACVSN